MKKAFIDGSTYWLTRKANKTKYDNFIVSINMADHVSKEITLTMSSYNDGELTGSLAVFSDSLCLFAHESLEWWHIQMMGEGFSRMIWCHQFEIDCSLDIYQPQCFMKNGEVIFESIEGDLCCYDHRNQSFQYLHFPDNPDNIELCPYKDNLVLLDLETKSWPIKIHNDRNEELERKT